MRNVFLPAFYLHKAIKFFLAQLRFQVAIGNCYKSVRIETIEFVISYDVSAFFEVFDAVKINSVAKLADLNPALLRQYVSGVKHPSSKQVQKIETAIRQLGRQLVEVSVF